MKINFRTTEAILQPRPIYHRHDATIRGHVFCSYLALLLKCELKERMRAKELQWEWKDVIRRLGRIW